MSKLSTAAARAAVDAAATTFGVPPDAIVGEGHRPGETTARHAAWMLAKEATQASLRELGRKFQRSPEVIRYGCRRAAERSADPTFADLYARARTAYAALGSGVAA